MLSGLALCLKIISIEADKKDPYVTHDEAFGQGKRNHKKRKLEKEKRKRKRRKMKTLKGFVSLEKRIKFYSTQLTGSSVQMIQLLQPAILIEWNIYLKQVFTVKPSPLIVYVNVRITIESKLNVCPWHV